MLKTSPSYKIRARNSFRTGIMPAIKVSPEAWEELFKELKESSPESLLSYSEEYAIENITDGVEVLEGRKGKFIMCLEAVAQLNALIQRIQLQIEMVGEK